MPRRVLRDPLDSLTHEDLAPRTLESTPPPAHLSRPAREKWNEFLPQVLETSACASLDLDLIAAYCESYVEWVEAKASVERNGTTTVAPNGQEILHPTVHVRDAAFNKMQGILHDLGLTPNQRMKLKVSENDPLDEYAQGELEAQKAQAAPRKRGRPKK